MVPFEEAATFERELPGLMLSMPFPFTVAHNPYDDPALADYWKREASGQLEEAEYQAQKAREVAGTVVLCHEGCGHLHLLVVNGPAYGQVWLDSTVSDAGYAPLGVSFLDWYERWLDDVLVGGDGIWWARRG
jgi:hypothetical protein